MASFVVHNIAGEKFLRLLEESGINLSPEQKDKFLLGNLIVDSSKIKKVIPEGVSAEELKKIKKYYRNLIQDEKIATHFRDNNDLELCIQKPDLSKFINKYGNLFKEDISVLGYFFHLFTDKLFFEDLFKATFSCLDKDGRETNYAKEVTSMYVKKNGRIYSQIEFWNGDNKESIYHDYTVMNKILLEYYGCIFDKNRLLDSSKSFINPGIEEVDYSNITSVLNKTESFIKESYATEDNTLYVFDYDMVKNFISVVAHNFFNTYYDLIKLAISNGRLL